MSMKKLLFALCAGFGVYSLVAAAEPKPVPRMQAVPLPRAEVSFQREGEEIARYYFGPDLERPFVCPIIGPAGRSLTRMGHPQDPEGHSHHNSVWIAHQDLEGLNFWEDKPPQRIVHQRMLRLVDGDGECGLESENAWLNGEGGTVIRELRRVSVQPLEGKEWLLLFDLEFHAPAGKAVTFNQSAFGLVGVRMAKTIGVRDGGGTIRNSEGGVDEAGCFRKPARWVDYAGPITSTQEEGITLMDHPMNVNHPAAYHVRNDGWMGAAMSFKGAVEVTPERSLRLRYALYVHSGRAEPSRIEERWQSFAATEFREFALKKK
jgi:hypothetical protein